MALRRPAGLVLLLVGLLATSAAAGSLDGTVVRVVDGDTIYVRLADRVEKIRYIGVDAPEMHHVYTRLGRRGPSPATACSAHDHPIKGEERGGREAAAVNRRLVGGRHVRLELDVRTRDRYGRLLAYVWAGDTMVNAERSDWATHRS